MVTKKERLKIQSALPISKSYGYKLIKEKCPHLTNTQISQAFLYDDRYKPEVMDAAIQVIDEYKTKNNLLKDKVAAL